MSKIVCSRTTAKSIDHVEGAKVMIELYSKDIKKALLGLRTWGENEHDRENYLYSKRMLEMWRKKLADLEAVKPTIQDLAAKFNNR